MFVVRNRATRIGLFLVMCSFCAKGQEFKPVNVSLSFSPYVDRVIIAPSVNLSLGERFEIGLLPFAYFYKYNAGYYESKQKTFGLNLTSRYFLNRGNKMEPYVAAMAGYGLENLTYTNNTSGQPDSEETGMFDAALLLGNELKLGQKGWIFDFNVGLLGLQYFDEASDFQITPIYSFGIKKKFLVK